MDVRIENQTSKSDQKLGTNGGNSTLFQRKKAPNSCKTCTVANVLRVMKHIGTTKFNEKIKGSQNHEIHTISKLYFETLKRLSLSITKQKHKNLGF